LPENSLVIPGLHDAHAHLLLGGLQLGWCNFVGVSSAGEFHDVLTAHLREHESRPGQWVQGTGLDEASVRVTRDEADRACPHYPLFIWHHDLHSALANTAALELAGIAEGTPDPEGGRFERDASGRMTGVLRENAAHIVEHAIPEVEWDEAREALLRAQEYAFAWGITAVSSSTRPERLLHYLRFAASSDAKLRLNIWPGTKSFNFSGDGFRRESRTGLRVSTIKAFADGALGSRTAAFFEPYAGRTDGGIGLVSQSVLSRYARSAFETGWQMAVHAIGDRAIALCLDAFDEAGCRGSNFRPRIEHVQHLREQGVSRLGELGVVASMQPIHCTADMRFVEERLGEKRAKLSYAWRSVLRSGATLAFGSDWPVEDLNPIAGIHAAVTRQDTEGNPPGGWQPQERLTVEEALRAYTQGAAHAAFWEEDMGTLDVGKLADFTVLSENVFECDPLRLRDVGVLMTVVGGEIVYESPALRS